MKIHLKYHLPVYMIKTKVAFLKGRLFPANQGFLKTFQIVLIGWIIAGPPKKPVLFNVNRLQVYRDAFQYHFTVY